MDKGIKITFGIGVGERANGSIIGTQTLDEMMKQAEIFLARSFNGYTKVCTNGGWFNGHNRLIEEKGISYFCTIPLYPLINLHDIQMEAVEAASKLKAIFEQEAIYLELQEVRFSVR